MSGQWRLDRQLPLGGDPEWFDTEAEAQARHDQLQRNGSVTGIVVWHDTATYHPIPEAQPEPAPLPPISTATWREQLYTKLAGREGAA